MAAVLLPSAYAGVYLTEGFNYSAGNLTGWLNPGAGIQVTSPGMTLATLTDTSPSGNRLSVTAGGNRNQSTNFVASPYITNGTVYLGFLLNCTTLPTADTYLIGIVSSGNAGLSGSADPMLLYDKPSSPAGSYQLRVRHTGTSESTAATNLLSPNTTNFIVMKYTFGSGGTVSLFINPSPIGTEPATPDSVTASGGTDAANLAVLAIKAQSTNASGSWDIDTIRIGSTWTDVAQASGACIPASVSTPTGPPAYAGLTTTFQVLGGGSSPTYQWQISTNSGSTWANIVGATANSYLTPAVGLTNSGSPANGTKYRCTVSVSCGSGTSTSSPAATLTVLPAPNYTGVIVSNVWNSINANYPPPTGTPPYSDSGVADPTYGDIESCWFALGGSTTSGTGPGISVPAAGQMDLLAATNSRTWLTYFTSNGVVNLNLGEQLKVTTIFQPQGVVLNTNANMAFGLFNSYAPGAGQRLSTNSSSSSAGGAYFQGYNFIVNFSTIFQTNNPNPTPIEFQVRTNLSDSDIMGNGADYTPLGSGGSTQGATGFTDNGIFTNVFSVARGLNGVVTLTSQFTGPSGFNISYSTNDFLNTNNIAFDTFAIRPSNNATTATNFIVTLVKIEKGIAPVVLTPIPLNAAPSGGNIVFTWTNASFNLYGAPAVTGTYSLISGAASGYSVPATNFQRYFRLRAN